MISRAQCPACENSRSELLLQIPYSGAWLHPLASRLPVASSLVKENYTILHCVVCGLYYQERVCDEEDTRRLFSPTGMAELAARLPTLAEMAHFAEEALLIRLLVPGGAPKILDFGMGAGDWAGMARGFGCEVWGTDIDPRSVDAAKRHGVSFVTSHELPPDFFDFVNADQVIEHLAAPVDTLRMLARSLRRGGLLKISTPGDRRFAAKIARAKKGGYNPDDFLRDFEVLMPLSHLNLFGRRSLLALGARAGLRSFRVPLKLSYSTMTLFHTWRQWNRNLYHPFKRWCAKGTWQFFEKM